MYAEAVLNYLVVEDSDRADNCSGSALEGAGGSATEDTKNVRAGANRQT